MLYIYTSYIGFRGAEITLKVWNKEDGIEGSTPLDQLDIIMMELQSVLEFETKIFSVDPKVSYIG